MTLLSGNEAIARGAYEAGVTVAVGYPGTPSTEILENAVAYKNDIYCEWSPNEKVALEVAAGAAYTGARAIVTMKHVGLNVAADPLMTLAYTGTVGGILLCVADDPGMHSSQNEQDTRHYARFARIPVLEPSDSQEAKDFVALGIELSEKYETPVILRSTTRVSHSRSVVREEERRNSPRAIAFEKNPPRFVPLPMWGRVMRVKVEQRLARLAEAADNSPANRLEPGGKSLGIIAVGIAYQYVKEVWPEATVLKLGMCYPFPDKLIRQIAGECENLLVVEELDPFVEEHVRAMGIACTGKEVVPVIGELSTDTLRRSRALYEHRCALKDPQTTLEGASLIPPQKNDELPGRPPVLCPGCPHRGVFYALTKFDVVVTGDIGCYSLGAFKPLDRMDTILCMGGGVSMAHGMDRAGEPKKVVGMVGDSTFFHSGITGLIDVAYNRGSSTIIVVDNRITAMTGHQENPGSGLTLMGEKTAALSIPEIGRACGIRRVREINPLNLAEAEAAIGEELAADEPSLIVSVSPCVLHVKKNTGPALKIAADTCRNCRKCLKLGCPAIEAGQGKPVINAQLCTGCTMCAQLCAFGAISEADHEQ